MSPDKRATIVQISDLHMNGKVSPDILTMLANILTKAKPDVLIISGDLANQPVHWQMKRAAREVNVLVKACHPHKTIIIPGNHDFKFW
jgi:predicted MPP superfamily phosphohydrolase